MLLFTLASPDGFSNKYTNILEMKDKQKHTLQTTWIFILNPEIQEPLFENHNPCAVFPSTALLYSKNVCKWLI